jgi:hypothetical protein
VLVIAAFVIAHIFVIILAVLHLIAVVLLAIPHVLAMLFLPLRHRVPPVLWTFASDQTVPDPLTS